MASKQTPKHLAWQRPRLAATEPSTEGPDALWAKGVAAEEAYEFAAARDAYRQAAAATGNAAALDYATRYAEFLVERFGQFDEVAAWLDDASFAAPAVTDATAHTLARLLARAAHETQHPRAAEVDERAAAAGDSAALLRAVERQAAMGDVERARQRLEPLAASLSVAGMRVLERLRQAAQSAVQSALAPVETALATGDVAMADTLLRGQKVAWGHTPIYHALEQKVAAAGRLAGLAAARLAVEAALAHDDLVTAERSALALVALPGATPDDRSVLQQIRGRMTQRAIAALWQDALAHTDLTARLTVLARLVDDHGVDLSPPPALTALWNAVRLAAQLPHALPLGARVPALQAWLRLLQADAATDPARWSEALRGLPEAWNQSPQAQRVRDRLRVHEQAQREAAESAVVAEVQSLLDADQLDAANQALDAAQKRLPQSAGLKTLRAELSHLRLQVERRDKLRSALDAALGRGDVLTARARLAELVHFIDAAERQTWTQAIETRAGPLLKAKALPPGVQKLQNQALLTGVGLGRLVIVQETVWLTVNLQTGGIAPFALPDGWPVQVHAWTRIGVVGERLRLVGLSNQRLVVMEQVPGQPPQVVAGMPLVELLGDDDSLMGAALTPDAATWVLLSRSSTRNTAPTWTRLDATTLAVLDRKKAQPKLDSLAGMDGQPAEIFAVAAPKHRADYAVALTDTAGQPRLRFSENDIGEAVSAVREVTAWPAQDRIYARYAGINPFSGQPTQEPSLLVIKNGRVTFASSELRKRFAPLDKLAIDHAWTLDQHAGRLWFAAQSTVEGAENGALLLGVDARTLRSDKPVVVDGVERILALHPVADGAVALTRLRAGGFGLTRANLQNGTLSLTTQRLPL